MASEMQLRKAVLLTASVFGFMLMGNKIASAAPSCAADVSPIASCENLSVSNNVPLIQINALDSSNQPIVITGFGFNLFSNYATPAYVIDAFINAGTISSTVGVDGVTLQDGVITNFTNSGVIEGQQNGLSNYNGYIGNLLNEVTGRIEGGLIPGQRVGIMVTESTDVGPGGRGSIGTIDNYGEIIGNGEDSSGIWVWNATAGVSIASLINRTSGVISGLGWGVRNEVSNTISDLSNAGNISGYRGIGNRGGVITNLANTGTINAISADGVVSAAIYNENAALIGTLNNAAVGTISAGFGSFGIYNFSSTINSLSNSGLIDVGGSSVGVYNNASTITALTNTTTGIINSDYIAIENYSSDAVIGTLSNSGRITSSATAIANRGSITTLTNASSGSILADDYAIYNDTYGHIVSLTNSGEIFSATLVALNNLGEIQTLTNNANASIHGSSYGIYNDANGTIGVLDNSGSVVGASNVAINNLGAITSITNHTSAAITGGTYGIFNETDATIGSITNNGQIVGTNTVAINNKGSINTIDNHTGAEITGYYGIYNDTDATIGSITNDGQITGTGVVAINNIGSIINLFNNTGAVISGSQSGVWNALGASIYLLDNAGTLEVDDGDGIDNEGVITTLNNSGSISAAMGVTNAADGSITTFSNLGTIATSNYGLVNYGDIYAFNNAGTLSGSGQVAVGNLGTIATIDNTGTLESDSIGIANLGEDAVITTINNSGTISGSGELEIFGPTPGNGVLNWGGTITSIVNSGEISGITNIMGEINVIQNTGTIDGIYNYGNITTGIQNNTAILGILENSQGGSSPLLFSGKLPEYYNIAITSSADYGKVVFASPSSSESFRFGISSLSYGVVKGLYSNVMTGVTLDNIASDTIAGISEGYRYTLINRSGSIWDLMIGPSLVDTQASLSPNAYALRGAYNLQSSLINTSLHYDCTTFDKNGICVSAGGRYTSADTPSTNSQGALLIGSYRLSNHARVGAYLDQGLATKDAKGINLDNGNPMGGLFAVWNQNTDGTGYETRVAAAYSDRDLTVTRSLIGMSEAGYGKTSLKSFAVSGLLSRGIQLGDSRWIASPYVGIRYTKIKRYAYTEDVSEEVTTPLTYADLSQETTSALLGVRLQGRVGLSTTFIANVGLENDIAHHVGRYSVSGFDGLTAFSFNNNIKHVRPVASVGASYSIDEKQRIGVVANYRQEAFQSSGSVSAFITYQLGF